MSEGYISIKKAIPIIVVTWILSLVTTLALVYFTPFVPIGTNQISDSSVTSSKIAENAIITTTLADGSVSSAKIVDGTIIAQDMADGSILSVKVADGAITATKIVDGSITAGKMADNSVTTTKIADSAILTVKLADGSITSAKILDGTVTAADIADGTLTSVKIADGAITTTKIVDYAVTSLKLAPNAIPFASTSVTATTSTTSLTYADILDTSVIISLARTSNLLIVFTSEFGIAPPDYIAMRARVGTNIATPSKYQWAPSSIFSDTRTCSYFMPSVANGTYIVKMQWFVSGGTGYAHYRMLTVIALPA